MTGTAVPPPHGTGDRPAPRNFIATAPALLDWLPPAGQRLFGLMMGTYRVLLRKIAQRPEDVFRRRIRLSRREEVADCRPLGLAAAASLRADVAKQTLPVPPPAMTSIAARTAARVAVVGGGLAGLSAAAAAAEHGCRVDLFEQAAALGGRAASFRDRRSGQLVDTCQHLALGCCTNFIDLCRRTGLAECFQRDGTLHFFAPDGVRSDFAAVGWLPAPLHLLPALLGQKHLTPGDRWRAIGTLLRLARLRPDEDQMEEAAGAWLRRQGQSPRAIARFWAPVILSALGETPQRASLAAVRKAFVDGLLAAREAYALVLPRLPLQEWIDGRLGAWLADRRRDHSSRHARPPDRGRRPAPPPECS